MEIPHSDQSDSNGLFISWGHPASGRFAILEELEGMAWLYLSRPGTTEPERDCPAFLTRPPAEAVDWKQIAQEGGPPPITQDVASDRAVIEHPSAGSFSTVWTMDGDAVALCHRGEIICMIIGGQGTGHSKAIRRSFPLGQPFDEALAASTFSS